MAQSRGIHAVALCSRSSVRRPVCGEVGPGDCTIDCYSASTGWRYRIWESATLAPGSHYIQIRPLHTKSAAATNYVVVVDALDVTP